MQRTFVETWAAQRGQRHRSSLLVGLHDAREVTINMQLRAAAARGYINEVRQLCELPAAMGVDPAAMNNLALLSAAGNGFVDVVRYLCELPAEVGIDPATRDNTAVQRACRSGHFAVVRYLCELPPNRRVYLSRGNAIRTAVDHRNVTLLRWLVGCVAPSDPDRIVTWAACEPERLWWPPKQRMSHDAAQKAECTRQIIVCLHRKLARLALVAFVGWVHRQDHRVQSLGCTQTQAATPPVSAGRGAGTSSTDVDDAAVGVSKLQGACQRGL